MSAMIHTKSRVTNDLELRAFWNWFMDRNIKYEDITVKNMDR
jgi:hypothetical protein